MDALTSPTSCVISFLKGVFVLALRFFENGEDVPFAVEFLDNAPSIYKTDADGPRVFKIMPDKSFKRASGPRVEVWLERARDISEARAMELAEMWGNMPRTPAS